MTLQPAPTRPLPVPLLASTARRRQLQTLARTMVAWVPTERPRCDLDLLITGAMSPNGQALMAAIPMAMRMSGPRDSLWNAILRATFGCTHYIVGRDHASPGPDHDGRPFYEPYEAQDILFRHEAETGITTVAFPALTYVPVLDGYVAAGDVPEGAETRTVSGTELRSLLASGGDIPEWITFPEVAAVLRGRLENQQAADSSG